MRIADMNAGKALKILMVQRDISRDQLSKDLGLSSVTISNLRNSKLINGRNLVKLCDYFNLKGSEFLKLGEEEA